MPPREASGRSSRSSDDRVTAGDCAHRLRACRICYVPYLMSRVGVGAEQVELGVLDRQRCAGAYSIHLRAAVSRSPHREVEQIYRGSWIGNVDNRRAVWVVPASKGIERWHGGTCPGVFPKGLMTAIENPAVALPLDYWLIC